LDLRTFVYLAPCVLLSLTLHELAHAVTAWKLGDPTAKEQGRLTLNPLRHLDPLGTAMFAITALAANVPFGWAKPVPVQPGYFKRPKEGMALVAAAGPITNFLLALVALTIIVHTDIGGEAGEVVYYAYLVNVVLGIFNLIPIPPLDGSRIVAVFLRDDAYRAWSRLDAYGMILVLGLFLVFRDESSTLLQRAYDAVTDVMVRIVGA
jgi:Zn-dependent protease